MISIVALVLAAGGMSIAKVPVAFVAKAIGLNNTQKKQVTSIADNEISKKASKLSVLKAKTATNATNAINATHAATGPNMSDYLAPSGKTYQGLEDVGDNSLGAVCWGNSLIGAS